MKIVIENIKMPINHNIDDVLSAAREIVRSDCVSARDFSVYKQSIDARRKSNIHYVYAVEAEADSLPKLKNVRQLNESSGFKVAKKALKTRPVVVGMGPCGLFAAYVLALSGNPPIVLERGCDVDARTKTVEQFWQTGVLDKNCNVQFGEGGAGTFSDGKLTTRIGDRRQKFVLEAFVKFGAPEDILYKAKAHIGTDLLCNVIKNMRNELIRLGADIRFNTCVTDIKIKDGRVRALEANGDIIPCDNVILAIGHSSRDTYEALKIRGVELTPKPFAMGVRIEHSQKFIDTLQYGTAEGLPPADYRVVYNGQDRSCYSFCMCPGGTVVNASSENGLLAVNGMSLHARSGKNANSALVVNVNPSDFDEGVLGGVELQRRYERLAFVLGGSDFKAPVQLADDFVRDIPTTALGTVTPTSTTGFKLAELKNCLPSYITDTLRDGLSDFERRMPGFCSNGAVLTAIESRTSAPVRITRGESLQSITAEGLYPSGEGAGFAGGIVSAAVDGIRSAIAILKN